MNPNYSEFRFPQIKQNTWNKIFRSKTPEDAISLIAKLLVYAPDKRLKPMDALLHSFFNELRLPETKLPGGKDLPNLFDFTKEEIASVPPEQLEILIPRWYRE